VAQWLCISAVCVRPGWGVFVCVCVSVQKWIRCVGQAHGTPLDWLCRCTCDSARSPSQSIRLIDHEQSTVISTIMPPVETTMHTAQLLLLLLLPPLMMPKSQLLHGKVKSWSALHVIIIIPSRATSCSARYKLIISACTVNVSSVYPLNGGSHLRKFYISDPPGGGKNPRKTGDNRSRNKKVAIEKQLNAMSSLCVAEHKHD